MTHMLATGDDDGVVKVSPIILLAQLLGCLSFQQLWDPRTPEVIREHNHHYDFISDFLWLEDKKHLVVTRFVLCSIIQTDIKFPVNSGDGTLSVLDVRNKKKEPFAQSEDQEDELLSMVTVKGYALTKLLVKLTQKMTTAVSGSKVVVGTQLGILSIFNRNKGWGDCVDRVPGYAFSYTENPSLHTHISIQPSFLYRCTLRPAPFISLLTLNYSHGLLGRPTACCAAAPHEACRRNCGSRRVPHRTRSCRHGRHGSVGRERGS